MSNAVAFVGPKITSSPFDPVDQRVIAVVFSDGTTAPPPAPIQTNALDPVSPNRNALPVGVVPPTVPAGILHAFPNDPSLTPQYTPPTP